ncbi:MAG TPA: hypothetical protein VK993_17100, partial [Chthoniobacterales bacterium]|nr:hypothetical protein [Chthoniobacterales bacterium]
QNMFMKIRLRFVSLLAVAAFASAPATHADVFQFDLLGKAGPGLLIGNEHPSVPASGGSGGERRLHRQRRR